MPKKVSKSYHKNINSKDIRIWKKWQKRTKVLALVGLLVALGAGGYYAYKSFAATATYTYTVDNGILHAVAPNSAVVPGETKKGKAGEQILVIQPNGQALVSGPQNGVIVPAGQKYVLCADVKLGGTPQPQQYPRLSVTLIISISANSTRGLNLYMYPTTGSFINNETTIVTDLSNGYKQYCTITTQDPLPNSGPVDIRNNSIIPLYLSSFTVKLVN